MTIMTYIMKFAILYSHVLHFGAFIAFMFICYFLLKSNLDSLYINRNFMVNQTKVLEFSIENLQSSIINNRKIIANLSNEYEIFINTYENHEEQIWFEKYTEQVHFLDQLYDANLSTQEKLDIVKELDEIISSVEIISIINKIKK